MSHVKNDIILIKYFIRFLWVAAREASAANHYVTVKRPIDVLRSVRTVLCTELLLYAVILSMMQVLHVNVSILFDCRYSAVFYFQINTCSNIRYSTLASPPFFLLLSIL